LAWVAVGGNRYHAEIFAHAEIEEEETFFPALAAVADGGIALRHEVVMAFALAVNVGIEEDAVVLADLIIGVGGLAEISRPQKQSDGKERQKYPRREDSAR